MHNVSHHFSALGQEKAREEKIPRESERGAQRSGGTGASPGEGDERILCERGEKTGLRGGIILKIFAEPSYKKIVYPAHWCQVGPCDSLW